MLRLRSACPRDGVCGVATTAVVAGSRTPLLVGRALIHMRRPIKPALSRVGVSATSSVMAASVFTAARSQWGTEPPLKRGLARVGHRIDAEGLFDGVDGDAGAECSDEQLRRGEGDESGVNAAAAMEEGEAAVEPSVVEFSEEEAAKLDRLFQRSPTKRTFLSAEERVRLEDMIFQEFYKDLGESPDDTAMRYQAALEITWLEEWVEDLMRGKAEAAAAPSVPRDEREARLLIKRAVLERVDLHKPLSYIIGSQPFFGCDINCRPPLLCPRPETEMWVHWYVQTCLRRATTVESPPLRVLDVCCGTGCIGVAIAKHVPRASVTALDLLPDAVAESENNARRNGIEDGRYRAVVSDMFACFAEKEEAAAAGGAGGAATQANAYPAMPANRDAAAEAIGRAQSGVEDGAVGGAGGGCCDHAAVAAAGNADGDAAAPAAGGGSGSLSLFPVNMPTRPKSRVAAEHMGTFDVLVSNPPYVLPEQYVALPRHITHWESKMALVGDDYRETRQYLYFQELCENGVKLLKSRRDRDEGLRHQPNMVIEVGLQAGMVASLMERSGLFSDVEVHLDYSQQERWITANTKH